MTKTGQTQIVERDEFWIETILASSPDAAVLVDESGRITHVNRVLEELFGWSSDELSGQRVEILLPERLHDTHPKQVQEFFRDPHPVAIGLRRDLYAKHRDGFEIPVEVGLNPIALEDRTIVLAIIRDISNRVELHKRLEMIFESAPTAMLMVDVGRRVVLVNSLFEEIFGYPRKELFGETVELLIPPTYRERHPDLVAGFFEKPTHRTMGAGREVFGQRKNGEVFPCELALSPMQLGDQLFVLAALADITERKLAEREFTVAREIQQAILPHGSPKIPGFDIAGRSIPARATGGDFFDFIPLISGQIAVVIGDVSGHGFGPALLSATTKSYFRALMKTDGDLRGAIEGTNNLLCDESLEGQFVTLFALVADSEVGKIEFVSAGHESFVFDRTGTPKHRLQSSGLPLGLVMEQKYQLSAPILLEDGDVIVAVTDGVLEGSSLNNGRFGKKRLFESIQTYRHLSADEILSHVFEALRQFCREQPQMDDITMIVIKVEK